jgi:DnaK suppressor protein
MTKTELDKFKSIIETKRAELTGALRYRDEIVVERASDMLDDLQLAREREMAIRNLTRDSSMSRLIANALARVVDGSFGVCQHCEEDISPKRLDALPWATFCIQCQDKVDRREIVAEEMTDLFAGSYR